MGALFPRMFIPLATLEHWVDSGHAEVGRATVVLSQHNKCYRLTPAIRVLAGVPEETTRDLVGKVLTEERVQDLGGELLQGSMVFGDSAFDVESGYVGTLEERPQADESPS